MVIQVFERLVIAAINLPVKRRSFAIIFLLLSVQFNAHATLVTYELPGALSDATVYGFDDGFVVGRYTNDFMSAGYSGFTYDGVDFKTYDIPGEN